MYALEDVADKALRWRDFGDEIHGNKTDWRWAPSQRELSEAIDRLDAIRKAGPPPGWKRPEPVHPVDEDDLCGHRADGTIERAAAWEEVCKVLFETAPLWLDGNGSGTERACETIRNMAKIHHEVAAVVEAAERWCDAASPHPIYDTERDLVRTVTALRAARKGK